MWQNTVQYKSRLQNPNFEANFVNIEEQSGYVNSAILRKKKILGWLYYNDWIFYIIAMTSLTILRTILLNQKTQFTASRTAFSDEIDKQAGIL